VEADGVDQDSETKRQMLVEAGYDFRPADDLWINASLDRQLDGGIEGLTVQQLLDWIEAGDSRRK
jgi:hypothetical protein